MKRQDADRPRSRLDHDSASGVEIMAAWEIEAIDVAGNVVPQLGIKIVMTASQAYGVSGAIGDEMLAHEVIDNAIDAVSGYHQRKNGLVVPGRDVSVTGYQLRQLNVLGDVDNRKFTIEVLDNAKTIISDMHARRKLAGPSTSQLVKLAI